LDILAVCVNLIANPAVCIYEMSEITRSRNHEALLVLSAQSGNQRAFEVLFRSFNPSLVRFASRLAGDDQLALDAVQDAWITISKNLANIGNPYAFRAHIFKAVRWRTIDQLRKYDRRTEELGDNIVDSNSNCHEMLATTSQIKRLVDQLPVIDRQAIYLFYLEDMTISELASILDIPGGTVKSRLNRARNTLKKLIEGDSHAND